MKMVRFIKFELYMGNRPKHDIELIQIATEVENVFICQK